MLAALLAAPSFAARASGHEICRFAGTTYPAGHIAVATDATATGEVTTVDVAATFEATAILWLHVRYMVEEISTWRAGELESVAVNNRYFVGSHIVRQQWDEFRRSANGLDARRVQGKTLADFRRKHPGFVQHWQPASFGSPWLRDYDSASPERRPDLDLAGSPLPSGLRSPLALAFYWIGRLPRGDQDVPVFLPGFKTERLIDLPMTAAGWTGGALWRTPLRYSALRQRPASTATAWTSPDGRLVQLAFELHGWRRAASGVIRQQGCEEVAGDPPPQGRQ